jgi:hypothetical protein
LSSHVVGKACTTADPVGVNKFVVDASPVRELVKTHTEFATSTAYKREYPTSHIITETAPVVSATVHE